MTDKLVQDILAFIDTAKPDDDAFETLACALFARQYAQNPPYRQLCDSLEAPPERVGGWRDIPLVPASAFKQFTLSCAPPEAIVAEWHSSGTTSEQRSRHLLDQSALRVYEASLRRGWELALPQCPHALIALMPSPEQAPHSSLSHMARAVGATHFFHGDNTRLAYVLRALVRPTLVFGTALAFASLLEQRGDIWRLPIGSVLVETGGFKGRRGAVSREELYQQLSARLGVPTENIHSEYGMSEMSSQFYGHGLSDIKHPPPWVRTRVLDPATCFDAPAGEAGLLCHYDLANLNSVLAVQTEDWGRITPDGFTLEGRAPGAELRGCSLTAEDAASC